MHLTDKNKMLMNWPERMFIHSPVRVLVQRRHARRWIQIAGASRLDRTLEIGCGLGRGAEIALRRLGVQKMFAFDLEESLVRRATGRIPGDLAGRLSYFVGDAQDFPFRDSFFDGVINYGIIHHVLDWRRCVAEIARVLKPGGLFYFEEIYPPLYANRLMRRLVRHPAEDRFDGIEFIAALDRDRIRLLPGVKEDSRFGIVGVARKETDAPDRTPEAHAKC